MATKRTRMASAAEPPASPKKRVSLGPGPETRDTAKKNKRKIALVEEEIIVTPAKSPKKATITAAITRRASKKLLVHEVEVVDIVLEKSPKAVRPRVTRKSTAAKEEHEGEEVGTVLEKSPKAVRPRVTRISTAGKEEG
jgi:hypothetical protein